jgi:WD40 repeat protein
MTSKHFSFGAGRTMTILLTCPECGGNLKLADNMAGKKIKCPKCAKVFEAQADEPATITAEPPQPRKARLTTDVDDDEDMATEELDRPRPIARNIQRDPATEAVSTIIPYKNGRALAAYYLGVFSLIPCVGLLLGPAGLILGILGLRYVKAHPTAKGTGHAIAGIIMGGLTTLGNWGVGIALVVMFGLAVFSTKSSSVTPVSPAVTVTPGGPMAAGNLFDDVNLGQPLFASDRDLIDRNQKLNLWAEPGRIAALRVGKTVHALAFSPDGKSLAIATQLDLKLWNLNQGQSRTLPVLARSLSFSPDGTRLAVGQQEPRSVIELYNTQTLALERKLWEGRKEEAPDRMTFSPDGKLFVATAGPALNVWDTPTWQQRPRTIEDRELAQIVAFDFDRGTNTLAVAEKSAVLLFDPTTLTERSRLKGKQIGTAALAWSSNGTMLVTGAFWGDLDLWDAKQNSYLRRLNGPRSRIHSLAFTAEDRAIVAGAIIDGTITVFDVASGKQLNTRKVDAEGKQLTAFAISPDRKTLVSGSSGGIVKAWDVTALAGPAK